MMENNEVILSNHSLAEREAYIGAIASLATADREGSEEEQAYISNLSAAAGLTEEQTQYILETVSDPSGSALTKYLDVLKNSDLKYSLLTDLMTFAKSDADYSEEEEGNIQKIANYLGINQTQVQALDEVAEKTSTGELNGETVAHPEFLASSGLGSRLQSAGINGGGLFSTLLGIAGPMILGGLISRTMSGNRGGLGGMLGGGGTLGGMLNSGGPFGGMFGGGGGMMSGGGMFGGGGLGSLIGMLGGGRMSNTGGLLGRILGGRFKY